MNRNVAATAAFLLALSACNEPPKPDEKAPGFKIDAERISVSGISAGAYMAGQYHLAHSSEVSGLGLIAGGPYNCARGSVSEALGVCMNGGTIDVSALTDSATNFSEQGSIDSLSNLEGDRVWIFHGSNDAIIHSDVAAAAVEFYSQIHDSIGIETVTNIAAPHGMPTTVDIGACDVVAPPFLNNCSYDAAGELLKSVTTIVGARTDQPDGKLVAVSQPGGTNASMLDDALLYVPASCASGKSCGIHIAFHGCQQSTEFVNDAFAAGAGFNEWADQNQLLVLYPQVAKSSVAPMNPLGCWDWWGYTGADYATSSGAQISVVKALVDSLAGKAN